MIFGLGIAKARCAAASCCVVFVLFALCGCSNYLTPWSAFQPSEYDLGPGAFVPEATPLSMPDSVYNGTTLASAAWYWFPAIRDTTYAITFYPRYDNAKLDIFDTASQSFIATIAGDTAAKAGVPLFWMCRKSGNYYLRVKPDSAASSGSLPGPGPFALSLKSFSEAYGSIVDVYEPDSARSLATPIPITAGNQAGNFQIHRITPGDTDWYVFSPDFGHEYELHTVGNVETKISLLSQAADSVAAADSGSGGGPNALLRWTCPYSSTTYTRYFYVTGRSAGAYGISVAEKSY